MYILVRYIAYLEVYLIVLFEEQEKNKDGVDWLEY